VKSVAIADLDYIEQVGDATLKGLFRVNAVEIKKSVVENVRSLDGATLVQQIEQAVTTGDWSHAQGTWEYIKSRRVMIKEGLTAQDEDLLKRFINRLRKKGLYVLKLGAIEDYLPAGFKRKDLGKLIEFVRSENFWAELPRPGRREIAVIGNALLRSASS
jgi:putative ATP-dependent endonuclease of OLD family